MKDHYPKFRIGCMEGGKIWFVPYTAGAVFELDIKSESVNFLSMLPVKKYVNLTEGTMLKHENKIYLAPCMGEEFLIYDIRENQFTKIQCERGGTYKFHSGFYRNKNIYFIGQEQALIARYDLEKERVYYIDEFQKEPACKRDSGSINWSKGGACINGVNVLIPNVINSCVLSYNVQENSYNVRDFEIHSKSICAITYANHACWLFPESGNTILRWDLKNDTVRHIRVGNGFALTAFMHSYIWNGNIILIDHQFLDVYFWDTERETMKYLPVKEKLKIEPLAKGLTVRWSYIWDSKIYLNIIQKDFLVEYDLASDMVKEISMNLSKESQTRYIEEFQKMKGREVPDTIPYISVISLLEEQTNLTDKCMYDENIGRKIFWRISN